MSIVNRYRLTLPKTRAGPDSGAAAGSRQTSAAPSGS